MSHLGKSIQAKITIWAGACLLLAAAIIIAYAVISLRSTAIKAAEDQAVAVAESQSGIIKAELEVALDAARTLAQALTAVKSEDIDLTRDDVNAMLKQVTAQNPQFVGTFTLWEPDAFDGRDAEFIGQAPYDETGRFIAYWNRNNQGDIQVETPLDYEVEGAGDYYLIPKRTKQETITEPYVYPVQGKDVLMTSLVVPIMVEGQFYGIAGIDVSLDFLQNLADDIELYNGAGSMNLISYSGVLAGVSNQPDLVGEHFREIDQDWQQDTTIIQEGETVVEEDEGRIGVFVPIHVGRAVTPWSVQLLIPTQAITAEATQLMWQMIGIGTFLAIAALVLLWFAAGQIARPIRVVAQTADQLAGHDLPRLTQAIQSVAQGDLSATFQLEPKPVQTRSNDEVGQMARAFNRMNEALGDVGNNFAQMLLNLRGLVGQAQQGADQVASASQQLNAAASQSGQASQQVATITQQVAEGTNQQAQAVNEATTNAEQMARGTEGIARGAQEQAQGIQKTSDLIDEMVDIVERVGQVANSVTEANSKVTEAARYGVTAVEQTGQGMATIRTRSADAAEKVKEMGNRSREIGRIVETIDDIADKTDMLALNAAVEAARAGEHGRGFAVVADQVRKLSEDSKSATRDIDALIEWVQQAVSEAVSAMENTTAEVDNGSRLAGETTQSLQDILQAAETAAELAERISNAVTELQQKSEDVVGVVGSVSTVVEENTAAAEQMAGSSQEVTNAMEGIASVAEENSASIEEVSASAEEMSAQVEEVVASAEELSALAEELRRSTAQFRIEEADEIEPEQLSESVWRDQSVDQTFEPVSITGNGHPVELQ